jgi:hypothetical protein
MSKKARKRFLAIGLLVVSCLAVSSIWMFYQLRTPAVTWGGPKLSVSERDYFIYCMQEVLKHWPEQNALGGPPPGKTSQGQPLEGTASIPERLLAVDLERHQVWLEHRGQASLGAQVDLPTNLSWSLYYRDANGIRKLPGFTCLQYSDNVWRSTGEAILLVGQEQERQFLAVQLWGRSWLAGIKVGEGIFDPNSMIVSRPRDATHTLSALVTDSELLQQMQKTHPAPQQGLRTDPIDLSSDDLPTKLYGHWRLALASICREAEQQMINRGMQANRMVAMPGPDYTSGLLGIRLIKPSKNGKFVRMISALGVSMPSDQPDSLEFDISYLGGGLWECRTFRKIRKKLPAIMQIDFRVQLFDDNEKPSKETVAIDKYITSVHPVILGQSRWQLQLDSDVIVEVVGVCQGRGEYWWGPDGSFLSAWPDFFLETGLHESMSRFREALNSDSSIRHITDTDINTATSSCTLVLYAPALTDFGNRSGMSGGSNVRVYYGQGSLIVDRYGQSVGESHGQYIVLDLPPDGHDGTATYGLGIRMLQNPRKRPGILHIQRDNENTGASDLTRSFLRANSYTTGDVDLTWIRLSNIALSPDHSTDFKMQVDESAAELPHTARVMLQP